MCITKHFRSHLQINDVVLATQALLGNKENHSLLIAQASPLPVNKRGISKPPDPERHHHLSGSLPELLTLWGKAESRNRAEHIQTHQEGTCCMRKRSRGLLRESHTFS